jgi:hypothetical protein
MLASVAGAMRSRSTNLYLAQRTLSQFRAEVMLRTADEWLTAHGGSAAASITFERWSAAPPASAHEPLG